MYYHRFLPDVATVLELLHKHLRKGTKWQWLKEQKTAFEKAKELRVVQYSSLVRVENVLFRLVQVGRFHNLLFYLQVWQKRLGSYLPYYYMMWFMIYFEEVHLIWDVDDIMSSLVQGLSGGKMHLISDRRTVGIFCRLIRET